MIPTAPSPPPAPPAAGGAQAAIPAEVVELPTAVANRVAASARGLTLSGTVTASTADGTVTVKLPEGEAVIKLAQPAQVGRPITLILSLPQAPPKPASPPAQQPAPLPQLPGGASVGQGRPTSIQAIATGPALTAKPQAAPPPAASPAAVSATRPAPVPAPPPGPTAQPAPAPTTAPPPANGPPAPPTQVATPQGYTATGGAQARPIASTPAVSAPTPAAPGNPAPANATPANGPTGGAGQAGPSVGAAGRPGVPAAPPAPSLATVQTVSGSGSQSVSGGAGPVAGGGGSAAGSPVPAPNPTLGAAGANPSVGPPAPQSAQASGNPAPTQRVAAEPSASGGQRVAVQGPSVAAPNVGQTPTAQPSSPGGPASQPSGRQSGNSPSPQGPVAATGAGGAPAGQASEPALGRVLPQAPAGGAARGPAAGNAVVQDTSVPQPSTPQAASNAGTAKIFDLRSAVASLAARLSDSAGAAKPSLPVAGFSDAVEPPTLKLSTVAELISTATQVDPSVLTTGRTPTIPQPGQQLTASLMFFVAALRGGNVRTWVGDRGAAMLESAGSIDLLARLTAEFSGTSRTMAEPPPGDWRSLSIPFQHGHQLSELAVHYHGDHPGRGEGDDEDGGAKRIMVDFTLSRSGPMRLDGLLGAKRFDLLVRSMTALPDWMQNDVVQLFSSACEASALAGTVGFRTGREGWATVSNAKSGHSGVSQLA